MMRAAGVPTTKPCLPLYTQYNSPTGRSAGLGIGGVCTEPGCALCSPIHDRIACQNVYMGHLMGPHTREPTPGCRRCALFLNLNNIISCASLAPDNDAEHA